MTLKMTNSDMAGDGDEDGGIGDGVGSSKTKNKPWDVGLDEMKVQVQGRL